MKSDVLSWKRLSQHSLVGCELAHRKGVQDRCGQISAVNTMTADLLILTVSWDAVTKEDFEIVPVENRLFDAGCGCVMFHHSALGTVIIRPPVCAKMTHGRSRKAWV